MAVPSFEDLMLPLLTVYGDGQPHLARDVRGRLADDLTLSDDDRAELLPSGRTRRFDNRIAWVLTHLSHAQLLESVGRATYKITPRGQKLLDDAPERLTIRILGQFPEYRTFRARRQSGDENGKAHPNSHVVTMDLDAENETPEESIEAVYRQVRQVLADELVERVKQCSPQFFEQLVVDLLVAMGYGGSLQDAGRAVGQSGDGGVDGEIKEDRLGLDKVYIQAKRWEGVVGRPVVQAFVGSLEGKRARKGVLITTSTFSREAQEYIGHIEKRIVLIDGDELASLMIEHNVGVTDVTHYVIKRVDSDYFEDT